MLPIISMTQAELPTAMPTIAGADNFLCPCDGLTSSETQYVTYIEIIIIYIQYM